MASVHCGVANIWSSGWHSGAGRMYTILPVPSSSWDTGRKDAAASLSLTDLLLQLQAHSKRKAKCLSSLYKEESAEEGSQPQRSGCLNSGPQAYLKMKSKQCPSIWSLVSEFSSSSSMTQNRKKKKKDEGQGVSRFAKMKPPEWSFRLTFLSTDGF